MNNFVRSSCWGKDRDQTPSVIRNVENLTDHQFFCFNTPLLYSWYIVVACIVSFLHLNVTANKVPMSYGPITALSVHNCSTQQFFSNSSVTCSCFFYPAPFELWAHANFTNNGFPPSNVARRQRITQLIWTVLSTIYITSAERDFKRHRIIFGSLWWKDIWSKKD